MQLSSLKFWERKRPRNEDRIDGATYQQSLANRYQAPEVTAKKIRELEDNAYFVKLEQNQRNLIFCEKVEIVIKDPKGDPDDELSEQVTNMCNAEKVRLNQKMIMIWSSVWRYGAAFINDVWGWRGSEYQLLEIRHLPAYTFADLPVTQSEYVAYGDLLRGVVLNANGELEYWQKQSDTGNPVQVTNVTMIKDPAEPTIAGTPGCLPAVHIIDMLGYCHKAQMQKMNRVGAPSIFPRITELKERPAGILSDSAFIKMFLKNWGINVASALRENMEFANPYLQTESCALDTINHYEGLLDRICSPSSLITKEGTLIGGSNLGELELMRMSISSTHRWLEEAMESLLQHYLEVNGFTDYTAEIVIPMFQIEELQMNINRVAAMRATPTAPALGSRDEMRDLIGLPPADDEIKAAIEAEAITPAPPPIPPPAPTGDQFAMKTVHADISPKRDIVETKSELEEAYDLLADQVIAALPQMVED